MMHKMQTAALLVILTVLAVLAMTVVARDRRPESNTGGVASRSTEPAVHPDGLLDSEMVWNPAVETLDWSDVQPPSVDRPWLTQNVDSDCVVVRGVAGSIDDAIIRQQLLPRLTSQLRITSSWEQRVAERSLRRELPRSPIVADRFQQTFYKTVADQQQEVFTREAVLLNLSRPQLARLARPIRRDLRDGDQIRGKAFTFAAIVISLSSLGCWIGYRYLNRVTLGYYAWPIRLTTAALILGSLGLTAGVTLSLLNSL